MGFVFAALILEEPVEAVSTAKATADGLNCFF
jgi:hypothetical protein